MAGLDNIPAVEDTQDETPTQGALGYTAPKSTGLTGKIALDPTETKKIKDNLQSYIDQNEGFLPSFLGGLNKARAIGYGPGALTAFERQEDLRNKQILDAKTQLAAYNAAGNQAQVEANKYQTATPRAGGVGGAGGAGAAQGRPGTAGGITDPLGNFIPSSQLAAEELFGNDYASRNAARQKFLSSQATEATKKQFAPAMSTIVEVFDKNLGYSRQMTQAQAEKLLADNPEVEVTPVTSVKQMSAPQIAQSLGIPIISGDRDFDKQNQLFQASQQPGYSGPPVAPPGKSKHQTGQAIDVEPSISDEQKQLLRQTGFKQPLPKTDPNHWEITTAPATVRANEPIVNVAEKPLAEQKVELAANEMPKPRSKAEYERQQKVLQDTAIEQAKANIDVGKKAKESFEQSIDPINIEENKRTYQRVQKILVNDPGVAGILSGPGYRNAIASVFDKGVVTPTGAYKIGDLENAIYQTLPTTTKLSINERHELASYLAKQELQASQIIAGQGAISQGERDVVQKTSTTIKDPAEMIYKRAKMLERRAQLDEKLGDIYGDGSRYSSPRELKKNPQAKELIRQYGEDLNVILNERVNLNKIKANEAAAAVSAHPEDIQKILDKNKKK